MRRSRSSLALLGNNDGSIYALRPDGTRLWKVMATGAVGASAVIGSDDTIYVVDYRTSFFALAPDGSTRWRKQSFLTPPFHSAAIAADGTIYLGTSFGPLTALRADGAELWSVRLAPPPAPFGWPSISNDGTIFVAGDTVLYALRPDGTMRWTVDLGVRVQAAVAVGLDGAAYVTESPGKIHVVARNGPTRSCQSCARGCVGARRRSSRAPARTIAAPYVSRMQLDGVLACDLEE